MSNIFVVNKVNKMQIKRSEVRMKSHQNVQNNCRQLEHTFVLPRSILRANLLPELMPTSPKMCASITLENLK